MKKIFAFAMAIVAFFGAASMSAQSMNDMNFEKYAKAQYGNKWTQTALRVADESNFDKAGNYTITKTIEAPGVSQEELYYEMAEWFITNYQNSIQMAEKADGLIIARPYVSNITSSACGWNEYKIDICPTVRVKVSDGLVKITYSLKDYGVAENVGGGNTSLAVACGLLATAVAVDIATPSHTTTVVEKHHGYHHGHRCTTIVEHTYHSRHHVDEAIMLSCAAGIAASSCYDDAHLVWPVKNCYPFCSNDSHKKASAKAFVVATTYSKVMLENMADAISQGELAYED